MDSPEVLVDASLRSRFCRLQVSIAELSRAIGSSGQVAAPFSSEDLLQGIRDKVR